MNSVFAVNKVFRYSNFTLLLLHQQSSVGGTKKRASLIWPDLASIVGNIENSQNSQVSSRQTLARINGRTVLSPAFHIFRFSLQRVEEKIFQKLSRDSKFTSSTICLLRNSCRVSQKRSIDRKNNNNNDSCFGSAEVEAKVGKEEKGKIGKLKEKKRFSLDLKSEPRVSWKLFSFKRTLGSSAWNEPEQMQEYWKKKEETFPCSHKKQQLAEQMKFGARISSPPTLV